MSHAGEPSSIHDADLAPTETAGYKIGEKKTLQEYAELDKDDESLQKWKASLGIGAAAGAGAEGPNVSMISLSLVSATRPTPIVLDLTKPEALKALKKDRECDLPRALQPERSPLRPVALRAAIVIKEGAEYAVELKDSFAGFGWNPFPPLQFLVNNTIVPGLKYIQAVKRAGIVVDKLESMIGSYGPSTEPVVKRFVTEEAYVSRLLLYRLQELLWDAIAVQERSAPPSGMLARSGSYNVRSRVIDDDKNIYCDFEWTFSLKKEW
ncbi:SPOSA6832_01109, partial [Sporobolomyces salmonicolor]